MWVVDNWSTVAPLIEQHLWLALVPTLVGLLASIPLAMVLRGHPRARSVAVMAASVVFTIPSLALFVIIPSVIGTQILDPLNVVIALSLYSISLTTRTALDSLDAVPPSTREAGRALGFSPLRLALTVDLPLAVPVLAAGTRVVAAGNVAMVSVGAVVGIGGLGKLFTDGYQRAFPTEILTGIVLIVGLAVCFDRGIALAARLVTPWTHAIGPRAASRRIRALGRSLPEAAGLKELVHVR